MGLVHKKTIFILKKKEPYWQNMSRNSVDSPTKSRGGGKQAEIF